MLLKFWIALLLFWTSLSLPLFASRRDVAAESTHQIDIVGPVGEAYCTAESVGPHALLTAAHCLEGAPPEYIAVIVDSGTDHERLAAVDAVIDDHDDHVILLLKHLDVINGFTRFDKWINTKHRALPPAQGQSVYSYGASKALNSHRDYRQGYVIGFFELSGLPMMLYSFPSFPGDSGSAIFDEHYNLIGVVSVSDGTVTGGFLLFFKPADWKRAASY